MVEDELTFKLKDLIRHNKTKENLLKLKISKIKKDKEKHLEDIARLRKYFILYEQWQIKFKRNVYSLVAIKKTTRKVVDNLFLVRKQRIDTLELQIKELKIQVEEIEKQLNILAKQHEACSRKKNKLMILIDNFMDVVTEIV